MNQTVFLCGEKIYLRPVEPEDLPQLNRWLNDPELRPLIGEVRPETLHGSQAWLERIRQAEDRVWFAVVQRDGDRLIGEGGLLRWFPAWRTSDISLIIGDVQARGRGFGREAIRLMMDYAFGDLNLHRLAIGVVDFNRTARRFWEKAGFKQEGVQEEGYYYHHAYHHFIMMRILEDEFRALYPPSSPEAAPPGV